MNAGVSAHPDHAYLALLSLLSVRHTPHVNVLVYDHEMRVMLAAGNLLETVGVTPAYAEGRLVTELIPARAWDELGSHFEAALCGEATGVRYRGAASNRTFDLQFAPVRRGRDPRERVLAGVVFARDVSDLAAAHEALAVSEQRHRLLADNSADMVIQVELDGTYTYVSPASERVTGYRPHELIGQNRLRFIHPDDLPAAQQAHIELLSGAKDQLCLELRLRHKDGSWRWVESNAVAVRDAAGVLISLQSATRDITARKCAEHRLRQTRELFTAAFEHAPGGVSLTAADGRFVMVNAALCELLGYSERQLLAMRWQDVVASARASDEGAQGGNDVVRVSAPCRRADGTLIPVRMTMSALRETGAETTAVVCHFELGR